MPNINFTATGREDWERARAYLERIRQEENRESEKTVELAQNSPIPWATELVDRISLMRTDDFEEVMMHHPGHTLGNAYESIQFFLALFNQSHKALENAVQHYHVSYYDPAFFSYRKRHEHDQAIFDLNGCLFNFVTAADALRNVCMKQIKHYEPEGHQEYKRNYFSENNLSIFIQTLRGALHHEHFTKAGPSISLTGRDSHETKLYLNCRKLLRLKRIKEIAGARAYVEASGVRIDVQWVFQRYLILVNKFYGWLFDQMDQSPEFIDYQRCLLERKRVSRRKTFCIFYPQWLQKRVNPYEHLAEYLDDDEISQVNTLPHRSREQVDKIIELADKDGACNDDIRKQIYALFKISYAVDSGSGSF